MYWYVKENELVVSNIYLTITSCLLFKYWKQEKLTSLGFPQPEQQNPTY